MPTRFGNDSGGALAPLAAIDANAPSLLAAAPSPKLLPADDGDETVSDDDTASEAAPSPYAGSGLVPPSSYAERIEALRAQQRDAHGRSRSLSLSPPPARSRESMIESTVDDLAGTALRSVYSANEGDEGGESDKNVAVVCRVRPALELEQRTGRSRQVIDFDDDQRTVHLNNLEQPEGEPKARRGVQSQHSFRFRAVFPPSAGQSDIYERVGRALVDSVMEGYNAAVIAYGQTGSGKTYTMIGDEAAPEDAASFGLIPRLTNDLFERMDSRKKADVVDVLRCSYIEIYMERVRDLLSVTPSAQDLPLRDDKHRGGLWVAGATEVPVRSWSDVATVLAKGNAARITAATQANPTSSRSHAIFIFSITTHDRRAMLTTTAQLYAVDLAGSENVQKSEVAGLQMDEAKKINTSLLALGQVVYALTQGRQSGRHVPYRDSKLTRILQNTFGGNSRTAMIINASPSEDNHRETLSSLRFGDRTQSVRNAPEANVQRSAEELEKLLEMAKEELKLARQESGDEIGRLSRTVSQLREERNHWRTQVDELKAALVAAQSAIVEPDDDGTDTESDDEPGPAVRASSASSVRRAALRTLSTLAPAPLKGEELFTMLRASPWAVVASDSEDSQALAPALFGCIFEFDGAALTVTGNDMWRALFGGRRGPSDSGLHTSRSAISFCVARPDDGGHDALRVRWQGPGSARAEEAEPLAWSVEMLRRDGDETVELAGELLPGMEGMVTLQKLPRSVVGSVMSGIAAAHQRMREADVSLTASSAAAVWLVVLAEQRCLWQVEADRLQARCTSLETAQHDSAAELEQAQAEAARCRQELAEARAERARDDGQRGGKSRPKSGGGWLLCGSRPGRG